MSQLEHPHLKATFDWLAPSLIEFSEKHSLTVERYRRGFPVWEFSCRHPRGGAASVQLGLAKSRDSGQVSASVQPHWWIELPAEHRRIESKFPSVRLQSLEGIRDTLEQELAMVLSSEQTALTRESRLADPALTAMRGSEFGTPEIGKLNLPT